MAAKQGSTLSCRWCTLLVPPYEVLLKVEGESGGAKMEAYAWAREAKNRSAEIKKKQRLVNQAIDREHAPQSCARYAPPFGSYASSYASYVVLAC